jgi:sec-independent protein translocase protein TatA
MGLGGLGMWEMIMIFLVVLLLFGAKRLPEIGSSLGKGIREFKGSIKEIEKEVKAVGEEASKDAVPPAPDSSTETDEGPRRLTTTPVPDASVGHPGGVPTAESQTGGVPSPAAPSESPTEEPEPETAEAEKE